MELLFSSGLQPLTVLRDIQVCCWITSKLVCSVFSGQCQCFQHILQTRLGTNKMCIQSIYMCCCRCASTQQICAPECSLHLVYHRFCFVIISNELHVFLSLETTAAGRRIVAICLIIFAVQQRSDPTSTFAPGSSHQWHAERLCMA